jgi:hypothetical protein
MSIGNRTSSGGRSYWNTNIIYTYDNITGRNRGAIGELYGAGNTTGIRSGYFGNVYTIKYSSNDTYVSGRALLGGDWTPVTSSYNWEPGGGPRCSFWAIAPLSLASTRGSQ